jgi:hypothetical protein
MRKQITRLPTGSQILAWYALIMIILSFVVSAGVPALVYVLRLPHFVFVLSIYGGFSVSVVAFAFVFVYFSRLRSQVNKRGEQLWQFAEKQGFEYSQEPHSMPAFVYSSIRLIAKRDMHWSNYVNAPDREWAYCDYSYAIYQDLGRGGEYKAYDVYYSVMAAKLPRKLPNVFFDSYTARERQFRYQFARNQRHSLEGDFDKYFVTYFPPTYTIDSLSFITPDVMLALRAAHDYDIEIVEDYVFLYGPLGPVEEQFADMQSKLMAIKKELLDNITTYRDERLPAAVGREQVALLGASLARSQLWHRLRWAGYAIGILYFALEIYGSVVR